MTALAPLLALLALAAQPADFLREEHSDLFSFVYGWPVQAAREPALAETLRRRMEAARAQALAWATEDRQSARADGREFHGHSHAETWAVDGAAAPLLSLSSQVATFTGGAHGNMHFAAILWDREAGAPVETAALLGAGLARIGERACAALDEMRAERRGEPVRPDPQDPFTSCPAIGEQVLALADTDGDARFDSLRVLIPPYGAGPYVEGEYPVEVPLDGGDLANVPDRYRGAFLVPGERTDPLPGQ